MAEGDLGEKDGGWCGMWKGVKMCERIKPFGRHDEQVSWSVLLSVLKQLYNRDSARQKFVLNDALCAVFIFLICFCGFG